MKIEVGLLKEHSKKQTLYIAGSIMKSKSGFSELMKLYLGKDQVLAQRASWVLSTVVLKKPEMIVPWLNKLLNHLHKKNLHDAVIRNGVKILESISIPSRLLGKSADLCFNLLADPERPIAVRCYAMTVLAHIAQKEPGLKNEILLIVEDKLLYSSAGFRSRAKKTIKQLETL